MAVTFKPKTRQETTPPAKGKGRPRGAAAVYLPSTVKNFIVRCVACGDTPSEIAGKVKDEFGLTVTRQACMTYDPRTESGSHLSAPLRELFRETRKKFLLGIEDINGSHKEIRLRRLDAAHEKAIETGQLKLVIAIAAEQRKQMMAGVVDISESTLIIEGGLPDWRHHAENMAIARAEYAQQQREEQAGQALADAFATDFPTDSPNQPEGKTP